MANSEQSQSRRKSSIADRLKGVFRTERPWLVIFGVALLMLAVLGAFAVYRLSREPAAVQPEARTGAARQDVQTTPGGNATHEYQEKLREYNQKRAKEASQKGSSYVPSALGMNESGGPALSRQSAGRDTQARQQDRRSDASGTTEKGQGSRVYVLRDQMQQMQQQLRRMSARLRERRQNVRKQRQRRNKRRREELAKQYQDQISSLTSELQSKTVAQKVKTFEGTSPERTGGTQTSEARDQTSGAGQASKGQTSGQSSGGKGPKKPELAINPGDILYARNEMLLNSDVGGPAQATILSGEYQGAKLLGGFEKKGNYLRVEFGRLITPQGEQHSIQAYAINPEVPSTAVRSDVDRHMLQRWGGLMAASFLSGLGEAVSQSGSTVTTSEGTTTKAYPDMDVNEQLWSAGGKVGKKFASKFEENFDRPSTVTLRSGQKLGILVLSTQD